MLDRFVGNLSVPSGQRMKLDVGELSLRLLLHERVIINTHRLQEVNELVECFGPYGFAALLEEGKLRLTCEAFATGFRDDLVTADNEFKIVNVWGAEANRKAYLASAVRENVNDMRAWRLRDLIRRCIELAPAAESSHLVRNHLHRRLTDEDTSVVKRALASAGKYTGLAPDLDLDRLDVTVQQLSPTQLHYQVDCNLPNSIDPESRRKIVSAAIGALAETGKRIDAMKRHEALTASKDGDLPLLEPQLSFLEKRINPDSMIQFRRVLDLTDSPTLPPTSEGFRAYGRHLIDVSRSAECAEFRRWLEREAPYKSDEEIQKYFLGWLSRAGVFFSGKKGRVLKFILVKAAQGILDTAVFPGAGNAIGMLDEYVLDKVIRPGGPVLFLGQTYPSLFKSPDGPWRELQEHSSGDGT